MLKIKRIFIVIIFIISIGCVKILPDHKVKIKVQEFIQKLKDENWKVRGNAAEALGKSGSKKAVEPLIELLKDKNNYVRLKVFEALGNIGDIRALEPLIILLKDRDLQIRKQSAITLGKFKNSRVIQSLIAEIINENSDIRMEAIRSLGEIGDKQAVEPLIILLKSGERDLQIESAIALGKIKDARSVEPLIQVINNSNIDLLFEVVFALGEIKDRRAIQPLVILLEHKKIDVRNESIDALKKIDKTAAEQLIIIFKYGSFDVRQKVKVSLYKRDISPVGSLIEILENKESNIRMSAATVLDKINWNLERSNKKIEYYIAKKDWDMCVKFGKPAVLPLINMLKDNDISVRKGAVISLGKIGDKKAIEPVIEMFKDEDWTVQESAVEALGSIGAPAVPLLISLLERNEYYALLSLIRVGKPAAKFVIPLLKNENRLIRIKAANILGNIGDKNAVAPLILSLQDKYNDFRAKSAEALGKIGDMNAVKPLILSLNDSDHGVRQQSAEALGNIGDKRAIEPLINTMKKNDDLHVRKASAIALSKLRWMPVNESEKVLYYASKQDWDKCAEIGAPAVGKLIELLGEWDTAEKAGDTLVKIGEPAVEPLINAFKSDNRSVRKEVVSLLGKIGDKRCLNVMKIALADEDNEVRYEAITVLGRIEHDKELDKVALENKNVFVRKMAVENLSKTGDTTAIEQIVRILSKDDSGHVRLAAANSLDKLGWIPGNVFEKIIYYIAKNDLNKCVEIGVLGIDVVVELLKEDAIKENVKIILVKIGISAVEPLIAVLKNGDNSIRREAVSVLGDIGDISALDAVTALIKDKDSRIREAAMLALIQLGDDRAVSLFNDALKDEDKSVRLNIVNLLWNKKDRKTVGPLISVLNDKDPDVKRLAAIALDSKVDKRAIEPFIGALEDDDANICWTCANALDKLGWTPVSDSEKIRYYLAKNEIQKLSSDLLIGLLKNKNSNLRISSIRALGERREEHVIKALIPILGDRVREVRTAAVVVFFEKMGEMAVKPLIDALKNEDWLVRANAASSLGLIKDTAAVEPLINILGDNEAHVKRTASFALGVIGDSCAIKPVINLLAEDIPDVRNQVIQSLSSVKIDESIKILISELKSTKFHKIALDILTAVKWNPETDEEKIFCHISKGEWDSCIIIGNPAIKPLIDALQDKDWSIRKGAAESLEKLNYKPESIEEKNFYYIAKQEWDKCTDLGKSAEKPLKALLSDEDSSIRKTAAETLDKLQWASGNEEEKILYFISKQEWDKCIEQGKPAAEKLILLLYKDNKKDIQAAVMETLVKIGEPAVIPCISALKYGYRTDTWFKLTDILGKIGKPALEPLIITLKDGYSYARVGAANALGKMKDKSSIEPLTVAINDDGEKDVKNEAKISINNIQGE